MPMNFNISKLNIYMKEPAQKAGSFFLCRILRDYNL